MQSQPSNPPPLEPSSWTNPRFYLWLFIIGAIIYNSITYANVAILGDFIQYFMYYLLFTLWYKYASILSFSEVDSSDILGSSKSKFITVFNGLLTLSIMFGIIVAGINVIGIVPMVGFTISIILLIIMSVSMSAPGNFNVYRTAIFAILNFDYAALSVLFPISMIHDAIGRANDEYDAAVKNAKTQTVNDAPIPTPLGKQIVYGSSLSILALTLVVYWWKFRNTVQLDKPTIMPTLQTDDLLGWQWLKFPWRLLKYIVSLGDQYAPNIFPLDFFKAFPLIEYAKYVANTDLVELAKKVSMVGLLAYVVYMIFGVYIQKKPLIPCAESSFSTCFKSPFPISTDIPYINLLVWTLVLCSVVNFVNWLIDNGIKNFFPQMVSGKSSPSAGFITLFQLLLFPFYWFVKLVAQYPVATIAGFMLFAAVGLLLYRSSFDLNDFVQGQKGTVATLLTLFIVSLLIFGVYAMNSSTAELTEGSMSYVQFIGKTGLGIAVMICLIGLIAYFLNSHSKLVSIVGVVQFGITALTYITGIALVIGLVRTLFSTSRKMGGSVFQVSRDPDSNWVINVLKLFANFLFYLPCLMLDFVDMAKEQYGLTTRPILLLLAAQAAFILIGRFLPSFVAKAINHTGVQILSAPVSMTTSVPITTYNIQFVNAQGVDEIPIATTPTTVNLKNYSYGVSAWFYIHPQPPNTNEKYSENYINLMRFGNFGPSVQYSPKTNSIQFSLYETPIELKGAALTVSDIPLQTWNNIVINSDKGKIDIFINNKLVYTGVHVPENKTNASASVINVEVGEADGVHGEMCNIVLNTEPFTKPELMWLYNTNKTLNPPVVGVDMDPQNQGDSASYLAAEAVDINAPTPTPMPAISTSGATTYGIIGAILGAIFGWLFNDETSMESAKGFVMGAIVFGLIGALLGALFSTDGTVAYVLKTIANVFVDTF